MSDVDIIACRSLAGPAAAISIVVAASRAALRGGGDTVHPHSVVTMIYYIVI